MGNPASTIHTSKTADDEARQFATAACTSDETEATRITIPFVLHAESDEDAADDKKHLALQETGRFTGVFQGSLRLTDADGNGGSLTLLLARKTL